MKVVADLVMRTLRLVVLEDFNICAKAALFWGAQDIMVTMTTKELSQHIADPPHERSPWTWRSQQARKMIFWMLRGRLLIPLSWSGHDTW